MSCLNKPVSKEALQEIFSMVRNSMERRVKNLLVACADRESRERIRQNVGGADLNVLEVATAPETLELIGRQYLDGIVLDLDLPQASVLELVEPVQRRLAPLVPPMILFGRRLTDAEYTETQRLGRNSAVRHALSVDRLLDESLGLLHRTDSDLSPDQRALLSQVRLSDPMLAGRTVLVVDDDLRNIFALSSLLEHHKLNVLYAENGRAGIQVLHEHHEIELVLMDIMMPEMDGYETMLAIRRMPEFEALPIIALTAKAMKGDRDKCLQAGASDYIAKPVDVEHLLSVMRVWIARSFELRTSPEVLLQ